MIEWKLAPEDVARIRFAFSPLVETVMSLIVLRDPAAHALHVPWVHETRPMVTGLDLSELFALVPVRGPTADFLSPPPVSPIPEFKAELATVRATSPDRVAAELTEIPGLPEPAARRIQDDPPAAICRIAHTLYAYWNVAVAPHWARIRALLEADVLWHSSRMAEGGVAALFEDLHETIQWRGDRLTVADEWDYSGSLAGQGLLLVPAAMAWPHVRKMIEPYQPQIAYPARGIGTLWETGPRPSPKALAALMGPTRAAVLTTLAEPCSTTALARRLGITPGAVSQHLSVLLNSGMVLRSRVGRVVLYRRTRIGDELARRAVPERDRLTAFRDKKDAIMGC